MAEDKLPSPEELEMLPSPEELEAPEVSPTREPSVVDEPEVVEEDDDYDWQSAAYGASDAMLGLGDIVAGAAGALGKKVGEWQTGISDEDVQKALAEQGIVDPTGGLDSLLDTYYQAKETHKSATERAKEEDPFSYYSGLLGGAVLTGGALSGAAKRMAGSGSKLAQTASKTLPTTESIRGGQTIVGAAKEGVKLGALEGLGRGDAKLLEGEVLEAGEDVLSGAAMGGLVGGTLSAGGKVLKAGGEWLSDTGIGTAFKRALRTGKDVNLPQIQDDIESLSRAFLEDFDDVFRKYGIDEKQAKEIAEEAGVRVSMGQDIDDAIESLIQSKRGALGSTVKDIDSFLDDLKQFKGENNQVIRLVDRLRKRQIQQEIKDPALEATKKLEKKSAQQAIKRGQQRELVEEGIEGIEDTIPGTLPGTKTQYRTDKFEKELDNGEIVEEMITNVADSTRPNLTPIKLGKTKDGKLVAFYQDTSTGKTYSAVGDDISEGLNVDSLALPEAHNFLASLNQFAKVAKDQEPTIAQKEAMQLAAKLRSTIDDAMSNRVVQGDRGKISSLYNFKKLSGLSDVKSKKRDFKKEAEKRVIEKFIGGKKDYIDERDAFRELKAGAPELAEKYQPEMNELQKLIKSFSKDTDDAGSKSAAAWRAVKSLGLSGAGKAGQLAKKPSEVATKSVENLSEGLIKLTNMAPAELSSKASAMVAKYGEKAAPMARVIEQAAKATPDTRTALLYSLYQQPAFRRMAESVEETFLDDE